MLVIAGVLVLALGLLAGAVLVLAPLGAVASEPGLLLWVLFPLLCLLGFTLFATQARPAQVRTITLASSALLLVLALASIAAIVLGAAGLIPPPANPAPLWFVLVVAGGLGATGAASFGRRPAEAA